ncbi:MAG TPA: SOS response-associated peptidase family protein [Burkholderiaceae bacterium]
MCYSAQVYADWKKYTRMFGATMSVGEFYRTFWRRNNEPEAKVKIPKAMEHAFADPQTDDERRIKAEIDAWHASEATRLEQELFAQRKRLADAERVLAGPKPTKKAADDARIAPDKIDRARRALADLQRTELEPRDSRIFPGVYAPVMVVQDGELVVMPMRYQCRPCGSPAFFDTKFPGTYNARRDNLGGKFWQSLFGFSHGIMLASSFFEHVRRHKAEGRELGDGEAEEDMILEFKPAGVEEMLVACLWARWTSPGQPDLLSFAAITDTPPPEVAAAGHDRCIIPIKRGNVDAWLNPDASQLDALHAILDDRERPFYEHRLAA